jgi:hypothetical protein
MARLWPMPDPSLPVMATDLLSVVRAEIEARMRELRPLVAAYEQMLAAVEALDRDAGPQPRRAAKPRASAPARGPRARKPRASAPVPGRSQAEEPRASAPEGATTSRQRAPRGAAQQAIIAALEHGSHTVSELVVVTAMSGANIRDNLRRLLSAGTVTRAKRDGKTAYALAS